MPGLKGFSREYLLNCLDYDPEEGTLTWKTRTLADIPNVGALKSWNTRCAGKEALSSLDGMGYKAGSLNGVGLKAHRVIYFLHHNEVPEFLDHINRDKADNRVVNLRPASHKENMWNRGLDSTNTTGYRGVSVRNLTGKYRARIEVSGRQKYLGLFNTAEEAAFAYQLAAIENYGSFYPEDLYLDPTKTKRKTQNGT